MTNFQFPASILTRPTYAKLEPRVGQAHLIVADAQGAEAVIELAQLNSGLMKNTHIVFIPKDTGEKYTSKLKDLGAEQLYFGASFEAALLHLRHVLGNGVMGLQIYLAGTEGLIGQAMLEATNVGLSHSAIQAEHRGSVARRMQCVHCKGITEDVLYDPFVCSHCGLNLFVRDHYSRRHAAFQGVCIDAEDPGNVPKSVELYK